MLPAGDSPLNRYLALSRTPWYSLVVILPLLALYEGLAWLVNWRSQTELRNGADVVLRLFLDQFGLGSPKILGALVLAVIGAVWMWQRSRHENAPLSTGVLGLMIAESALWAGVLLLALLTADQLLLTNAGNTVLRTALLATGAGIYEEGLFRLGLISALLLLFRNVLLWHPPLAMVAAIGTAAVAFALFHHVGPTAEPLDWNSVAYRSVAGILLGILYVSRGYGITAYAHTGYDLLVLGLLTVHS